MVSSSLYLQVLLESSIRKAIKEVVVPSLHRGCVRDGVESGDDMIQLKHCSVEMCSLIFVCFKSDPLGSHCVSTGYL